MVKLAPVKDNSSIEELSDHQIVRSLANRDLSVLEEENFLIFPEQVSDSADLNDYSSQIRRHCYWDSGYCYDHRYLLSLKAGVHECSVREIPTPS